MEAIKITNLTKYYGKARGIIDLTLCVGQGEFFGFIGPNGAGKSTTIRTLLGLIAASSGSAQILGMDIVKDKKSILQKVGYLPSEAAMYPGMRVKEVLKLSAELRHKDCSAEATLLCERLQLNMAQKVEELSFGNKKKVAIVCALQHCPELLILDEPMNGLDNQGVQDMRELFLKLKSEGKTILLASHNREDIAALCDSGEIERVVCDELAPAADAVEALLK